MGKLFHLRMHALWLLQQVNNVSLPSDLVLKFSQTFERHRLPTYQAGWIRMNRAWMAQPFIYGCSGRIEPMFRLKIAIGRLSFGSALTSMAGWCEPYSAAAISTCWQYWMSRGDEDKNKFIGSAIKRWHRSRQIDGGNFAPMKHSWRKSLRPATWRPVFIRTDTEEGQRSGRGCVEPFDFVSAAPLWPNCATGASRLMRGRFPCVGW